MFAKVTLNFPYKISWNHVLFCKFRNFNAYSTFNESLQKNIAFISRPFTCWIIDLVKFLWFSFFQSSFFNNIVWDEIKAFLPRESELKESVKIKRKIYSRKDENGGIRQRVFFFNGKIIDILDQICLSMIERPNSD